MGITLLLAMQIAHHSQANLTCKITNPEMNKSSAKKKMSNNSKTEKNCMVTNLKILSNEKIPNQIKPSQFLGERVAGPVR